MVRPNDKNIASVNAVVTPYSISYKIYVLAIFTLVHTFAFADRQLLVILIEPIKTEFGVSDTAMGLLSGLAFTLFYAGLAIPVARLADRSSRRVVVAAAIGFWSIATMACGLAQTFWQLTAARIAVGSGESGGGPASQSVLSDYFPRHQRATAMGIYATGGQLGTLVGLFGGALLAHSFGWRNTFICLGVPGVLLALLVRFTVVEPVRGGQEQRAAAPALPLGVVVRYLLNIRTIRYTALAAGCASLAGFGLATWLPSFLLRVHGVALVQAGVMLGLGGTLGGLFGAVVGGVLCDRLVKRDVGWQLLLPAAAAAISVPILILFLLWPETHVLQWHGWRIPFAMLFVPVNAFFIAMWIGPIYAAAQNLVEPHLRAQAAALILLIITLIGAGIGPLLVGALSDLFTSIRYALLCSLVALSMGALLFWRASVHYRRELPLAPQ